MRMVELFAVQDIFATALGKVEILAGGMARFIWYVERKNEDGSADNIMVASIVMATDAIAQNRQITDAALSGKPVETAMETAGFH